MEGVHRTERNDRGQPYAYWVASWWNREEQRQCQRWYAVAKYGEEEAQRLAEQKRLKETKGRKDLRGKWKRTKQK